MSKYTDNNNENELALKWDKVVQSLMNEPPHFIFLGNSVQEGNLYVCSQCKKVYTEKAFANKPIIQCNCGVKLEVPK